MSHFLFYNRTQSKKKQPIGFFLAGLLLFITSCSNYHCKDPMFVPLVISFHSDADTSIRLDPSYNFLRIKGIGNVRKDSLFQKPPTGEWTLPVSLNRFENSTGFELTTLYKNESGEEKFSVDTLTVIHTNTCGCRTVFRLDTVDLRTHYNITEAVISDKSVTSSIVVNYNEAHIKIYVKNHP